MELRTQPRLSVLPEKCLSVSTNSSTKTTVGLKTKKLVSKFLLLKGTKHAMISIRLLLSSVFCFWVPVSENESRDGNKRVKGS